MLAQRHHPDRTGGNPEEFHRIKTAYDALSAKHAAGGAFDDIFTDIAKELRRA